MQLSLRKISKLNLYSKNVLTMIKVENIHETISGLPSHTGILSSSPENFSLLDETRKVAVYIAGYIAKKLKID